MTIGLEKAFGLPALADILKNNNSEPDERPDPTDTGIAFIDEPIGTGMRAGAPHDNLQDILDLIGEGEDHGKAMDVVYDETLRLARDTADMAFQADMARQPRFLEVASTLFKTAIDAKNSKRENELKTLKLALDKQKADREAAAPGAISHAIDTEAVFHTDRNDIIAQAIAARKKNLTDE